MNSPAHCCGRLAGWSMHHRKYLFTRYHLASSGRAEKFSLKHFPPVFQSLLVYAQAIALNIITAVESITRIALTTAAVTGATGVQTADLGAQADHVKITRAGALVPNITPLSDSNISLHETHADRNNFVNCAIIGSQLRDWMVENQTTKVAFMMYEVGDGLEVPTLAYTADNDTLHFHIQYHPPTPASNILTARNSDYFSSPPTSQDNAAGISKAVVNEWFYNRQDATYFGYEEVFTDNGWGGHVLCYIPESRDFGLNSEISMCF